MKKLLLLLLLIIGIAEMPFAQTQFGAYLSAKDQSAPYQLCNNTPIVLEAQPNSDTLTFIWYKNGEFLGKSEGNKIPVQEAGNYKVEVRAGGFVSVSNEIIIGQCEEKIDPKGGDEKGIIGGNGPSLVAAVSNPLINPAYPYVLCGASTNLTLNASPTNAAYNYQWKYSATENGTYSDVSGATSTAYSASTLGFYKVEINDGATAVTSGSFKLRIGVGVSLFTASNNTSSIDISVGQSTNLNINFTGTPPFNFTLYGNNSEVFKNITTNNLSNSISVTPEKRTIYQIFEIYDSEGVGCLGGYNNLTVRVQPLSIITMSTPVNLNICPGNILEIPVTYSGTWGPEEKINVVANFYNSNGQFTSNIPIQYRLSGNPIKILIPPGTITGAYKVGLIEENKAGSSGPTTPSIFQFNVVNNNCLPQKAVINSQWSGSECSQILNAKPSGNGYTYEWFKNGVLVGSTEYFTPTISGDYTLRVKNLSTGFDGTSDVKSIIAIPNNYNVTLSASNLCSGPVTLSVDGAGSGFTYQWFKVNNYNALNLISNETNTSLTTSSPGVYVVKTWNGYCTSTRYSSTISVCPPQITSTNPIICGSNTQATLTTNALGTYQWSYASNQFGSFTAISGANTNSHTTSTIGYYKVALTNNGSTITSESFWVSTSPYAQLRNATGGTTDVTIAQGGNTNLMLNFFGLPPFTASLTHGLNSILINSTGNQFIQNVTPETSRYFYISNLKHGCGTNTGFGQNSVLVRVTPEPDFTISSISSTTCPRGIMQITINKTGNWGTESSERINVSLYTASNSYVADLGTFSGNIINVTLPATLTVGQSYFFTISPQIPHALTKSTAQFTVTSGCAAPVSALFSVQNSTCFLPTLTASPNGQSYTIQWKKDGIDIAAATSNIYRPSQSGNYSVVIQNTSLGYNSTSPAKTVTVSPYAVVPVISSPYPILCGSNTSTTITSNYTGSGFTYIWRRNSVIIPGATGPSITVSDIGYYYVNIVNDNSCSSNSNNLQIVYSGKGTLVNSNDNQNNVYITPPQISENLKVNLEGTGPWEVGLRDGNTTQIYYASSSPLIIPVSPTSPTRYGLSYVASSCGVNRENVGNISVSLAPAPTITFPTPASLNICRGNTVELPYQITGNLGSKIEFYLLMGDPTGGENRNVYTFSAITLDPLQPSGTIPLYIPNDLALGSYAVTIETPSIKLGNTVNGIWTNYSLNVINTGCSAMPAPIITGLSNGCDGVYLSCNIQNTFSGFQNTFQWYKNGVALVGKTSSGLTVYESGSYSVQVINVTQGYNQTSAIKSVTLNRVIPSITSSNSVICGSNNNSSLSTNFTGAGYNYQWYKDQNFSNGTTEQIPIFGANSSTYLATSIGNYSIKVFDGTCLQNSKSRLVDQNNNLILNPGFDITNTPTASLTNSANTNNPIDIAPAATENLKVLLAGVGPLNIKLYDGADTTYYVASVSPFTIPVSPSQSKSYRLVYVSNSCGVGTVSGSVLVNVTPVPSFNLGTPGAKIAFATQVNATACAGSTFNIPYTISGNWGAVRNMAVELYTAAGALVSGSNQSGFTANPIPYFVPNNLAVGSYKIKLYSKDPFISEGILSTYTLDIANTGCTIAQAVINVSPSCASSLLSAIPLGAGYIYQWYRNSMAINNATNASFNATQSGAYTVNVQNAAISYNETSAAKTVSINEINPVITATGGQICDAGGSVIFSSANSGGSFSHQWYYSATDFGYTAISGATASSYNISLPGYYYVIIKVGNCEVKSNTLNTCAGSINFVSQTICNGSGITIPITIAGGAGQNMSIQLLNAADNSVAVNSLTSFVTTSALNYNPTINIPNTVAAGNYKFKLVGSGFNQISTGILTIGSVAAGTAPIVTSSVNSITGPTNVTITATGCVGNISWNISDGSSQLFPVFTKLVSQATTFTAICTDVATGCKSLAGSKTVSFNCGNVVITAPANISTTTNTSCTATGVALGTATGSSCSAVTFTNNAPLAFPLGATTVTWTATDAGGATETATQTVTITDNVLPTITAPANVTTTTNTTCTATGVSLGMPTTADNCSVASTTNNAPTTFPIGATTVIWTVTDGSGNTKTATQTVTVTDNIVPTIAAPANINATSSVPITGLALGSPTTADNCSVASTTNNAPASFPIGITSVTWTVTDGSGNTATATQVITVTNCTSMSTVKSGAWNDPTVWSCGRIPVATDPVTINTGHLITVPSGMFPVKNITYEGGTIELGSGGNIELNP